jgi:hypothetical protein
LAALTAAALLVPFVAMQLTEEVNWSPGDFVVAGALLFLAGLAYLALAARRSSTGYRAGVGIAIGAALVLVWAELAVGIL